MCFEKAYLARIFSPFARINAKLYIISFSTFAVTFGGAVALKLVLPFYCIYVRKLLDWLVLDTSDKFEVLASA